MTGYVPSRRAKALARIIGARDPEVANAVAPRKGSESIKAVAQNGSHAAGDCDD
jgi:hypothetical protein